MCCSPYSSVLDCTRSVLRTEGLNAFYRAYPTALSMNIPFQASMVVTYGLVQRSANREKGYKPGIHFFAGAIAGAVASAVTMPLDVCKTLLNTQEAGVLKAINKPEVRGLANAAKVVMTMTGPSGFFQGLAPRVLYQVN
jgi:solute carrier family 25 iron transporter 28/37